MLHTFSNVKTAVTLRKVRKNNINHQAIELLLWYWANKASSFIAVHTHDKMTRRDNEEMLINRSARVLNK